MILVVVLTASLLVCFGCSSYEQPGETTDEGRRRHLRNERINQSEFMGDLDTFMLSDKPSKLTDKRTP
jgi:hypothetical protein